MDSVVRAMGVLEGTQKENKNKKQTKKFWSGRMTYLFLCFGKTNTLELDHPVGAILKPERHLRISQWDPGPFAIHHAT
jgi:hypothetical protein